MNSARVEAGGEVQATAVVQDSDTPNDQLLYDWSVTPAGGTFSGGGRQTRWKAPLQQAPGVYALTLKVTERYVQSGTAKENTASSSVQVHYNDSLLDIRAISVRFIEQLFSDSSVTPPQAVQDFSDSCRGKSDELSDISYNRQNFQILSGIFTNISIDLDEARTFADVFGTCVFEDIPTSPSNPNFNKRERVTGICHLTSIYESWRWWLCDSHFAPLGPAVPESLRYRVPGRILDLSDLMPRRRR